MVNKKVYLSLFLGSLLYGSTLNVYQDLTQYSFDANSNFIGFTNGITATCSGENVDFSYKLTCQDESNLCKTYNKINSQKEQLNSTILNIKTIDTLISTQTKDELNANKLIEDAKTIATQKAKLTTKVLNLKRELALLEQEFSSITTSKEPLYLKEECSNNLEITLPYGYITFKPIYEANIDENEIKVTQKISIFNRSGIDVDAKKATFYYKPLNDFVSPINFTPWVAQENNYKRVAYKKAMPRVLEANVIMQDKAATEGAPTPKGVYNDAREYSVEDLTLPSATKPTKVKILEYKSDLNCKLKAYPYRSLQAFNVCSFKPKYQIDSNSWIIKNNDTIVNKNAIGRYENGKYSIYTKSDKDILISRKPIVSKERQSGIFGGTKRQKDGFVVTITNKSNKNKKLEIIERIPTSKTDKIDVKLLSIKPKLDYKLMPNGKVVIVLNLKPKESKKVEILFELSYDKELKVSY